MSYCSAAGKSVCRPRLSFDRTWCVVLVPASMLPLLESRLMDDDRLALPIDLSPIGGEQLTRPHPAHKWRPRETEVVREALRHHVEERVQLLERNRAPRTGRPCGIEAPVGRFYAQALRRVFGNHSDRLVHVLLKCGLWKTTIDGAPCTVSRSARQMASIGSDPPAGRCGGM